MKLFSTLIAIIGLSFFSAAQQKYSKVKILTDSQGLAELASLGVAVDHGVSKKNTFFISDFSEYEIEIMATNGFEYEIIVDDVKAYYAAHSQDPYVSLKNATCDQGTGGGGYNPPVPVNHFENNSYAGFYKYQDMLDALDSMVALYPNLISARAPIFTFQTHEGRPIYHVKDFRQPEFGRGADRTKCICTRPFTTRVSHLSMTQTILLHVVFAGKLRHKRGGEVLGG